MSDIAILHRARKAKPCPHRWATDVYGQDYCDICLLWFKDYQARQKRARNNRSRGNRAELDIARTYGGQKVGPLGLPEDIRGTQWRTQVKVRQSAPPKMWTDEFRKLDGQRDGRSTRLILRFTRQGIGSEDFIVIRGKDWLEHWGRDD